VLHVTKLLKCCSFYKLRFGELWGKWVSDCWLQDARLTSYPPKWKQKESRFVKRYWNFSKGFFRNKRITLFTMVNAGFMIRISIVDKRRQIVRRLLFESIPQFGQTRLCFRRISLVMVNAGFMIRIFIAPNLSALFLQCREHRLSRSRQIDNKSLIIFHPKGLLNGF
jgi:hypothetical protein